MRSYTIKKFIQAFIRKHRVRASIVEIIEPPLDRLKFLGRRYIVVFDGIDPYWLSVASSHNDRLLLRQVKIFVWVSTKFF